MLKNQLLVMFEVKQQKHIHPSFDLREFEGKVGSITTIENATEN